MVQQTAATSKIELVGKWFQSESDPNKSYLLLTRKSDGIAVDCNCGDRVHRGRKAHRPCKHMRKFNTRLVLSMLAEWMNGLAVIIQEAAAAKATQVETVSIEAQAPDANRVGTVSIDEALSSVVAYAKEIDNPYDVLGPTKKVTCPYCHKHDENYNRYGKCYWTPLGEAL